jgi:hypothetical protein
VKRLSILITLFLLLALTADAQRYRGYGGGYGRGYDDDYKQFRIALQGGWSYRTAEVAPGLPAELKNYFEGLRPGFHFAGSASFFFNSRWGLGALYSFYHGGNSMTNVTVTDLTTGKQITGGMSDDISINFIGPVFTSRYILGRNNNMHLLGSVGVGYMSYKDDGLLITPYVVNGSTVGVSFGLGFDVAVSEKVFVGIEAGLVGGTLSKVTFEDASGTKTIELKEDERESLSRFDASGGLRFNL